MLLPYKISNNCGGRAQVTVCALASGTLRRAGKPYEYMQGREGAQDKELRTGPRAVYFKVNHSTAFPMERRHIRAAEKSSATNTLL